MKSAPKPRKTAAPPPEPARDEAALRADVAALLRRAAMAIKAGQPERATKVCDDVASRLKGESALGWREEAAGALVTKGVLLGELGQKDAALDTFNDVIDRFGDDAGGCCYPVAGALFEKAMLLMQPNTLDSATAAICEIDRRFGEGAAAELFKGGGWPKALVEECEETSYKPDMDGLNNYLKSLGVPQSQQPELAAKIDAFAKAAITGRNPAPKLSAADLAAFMAHAASHQWNPESKPKVAPSAFIKKTFKKWLKRGLALTDVSAAQENLAGAYSTEVSREPSKRVKGLYVRPHALPAGAPRLVVAVRRVRHVADLSEKEAAAQRKKKTVAQRSWRAKRRSAAPHLAM